MAPATLEHTRPSKPRHPTTTPAVSTESGKTHEEPPAKSKAQTRANQHPDPQTTTRAGEGRRPGAQPQAPQNQHPDPQTTTRAGEGRRPGAQPQAPQPANQHPHPQPPTRAGEGRRPGAQPQAPQPANQHPDPQTTTRAGEGRRPGAQPRAGAGGGWAKNTVAADLPTFSGAHRGKRAPTKPGGRTAGPWGR